jgi:hypothetical protein
MFIYVNRPNRERHVWEATAHVWAQVGSCYTLDLVNTDSDVTIRHSTRIWIHTRNFLPVQTGALIALAGSGDATYVRSGLDLTGQLEHPATRFNFAAALLSARSRLLDATRVSHYNKHHRIPRHDYRIKKTGHRIWHRQFSSWTTSPKS